MKIVIEFDDIQDLATKAGILEASIESKLYDIDYEANWDTHTKNERFNLELKPEYNQNKILDDEIKQNFDNNKIYDYELIKEYINNIDVSDLVRKNSIGQEPAELSPAEQSAVERMKLKIQNFINNDKQEPAQKKESDKNNKKDNDR